MLEVRKFREIEIPAGFSQNKVIDSEFHVGIMKSQGARCLFSSLVAEITKFNEALNLSGLDSTEFNSRVYRLNNSIIVLDSRIRMG